MGRNKDMDGFLRKYGHCCRLWMVRPVGGNLFYSPGLFGMLVPFMGAEGRK